MKFDIDLELVAVELITSSNLKFRTCCCYKSPQTLNKQWLHNLNTFFANSCSQYDNILICGDFNFPKVCWESPELTIGVDEVQFTELLNDYHLKQLNTSPTRGSNLLDLVITNVPDLVEAISVISPDQCGLETDYSTVSFYIKTSVKTAPKVKRTAFDYRRANFDGLRARLKEIDLWEAVMSSEEVNVSWLKWKKLFLAAVHDNIPIKTVKNLNSPPCMDQW